MRSWHFAAAYALDWIAGDSPSMPHPVDRGRYLRVAVRQEHENQRLLAALAAILEKQTCQQHT